MKLWLESDPPHADLHMGSRALFVTALAPKSQSGPRSYHLSGPVQDGSGHLEAEEIKRFVVAVAGPGPHVKAFAPLATSRVLVHSRSSMGCEPWRDESRVEKSAQCAV